METKRKVLVGICIALAVILALLLLTLGAVAVMGLLRQGPEPVQPPQTTPTQEPTTLPPRWKIPWDRRILSTRTAF